MAGYQTIEALRPILHRGPVPAPIVSRELVGYPARKFGAKVQRAGIERMCERRLSGDSCTAIAKSFGVSHTTVRRLTAHLTPPQGYWPRGRVRPRPKQAFAERLLRAGFTLAEVSEETGLSVSVVSDIRRNRQYRPWSPTQLCRVMIAVRCVTGMTAAKIRRNGTDGNKSPADIAKARHIVFWIAHRRAGYKQAQIAEYLGGFNPKTVFHGIGLAQRAVDGLNIPADLSFGRVARLLWQAEWPKAPR